MGYQGSRGQRLAKRPRPTSTPPLSPLRGIGLVSLLLAIAALAPESAIAAIARSAPPTSPQTLAQLPRDRAPSPMPNPQPLGGLYVANPDGTQDRFVLDKTDVAARIAGNVTRVEVTQTFTNPFPEALEAVYVFPLPDGAAVDEMEIRIGDRVIRGDIKKREEARRIYDEARRQGRTTGLLEQERDNIFTQSLANIRPGESIQVTIRYTESLKFSGGDYEFVFPMVVGPRYIPGQPIDDRGNTTRVPDASRINPPILPPEVRTGNDINVTVTFEPGMSIEAIQSPSHRILTAIQGDRQTARLAPDDTIPNKDLILRYRVAGRTTQATVLTQADDRGGHFATYLIPAIDYPARAIVPKDVVFLMDTSGSQMGPPLEQSKALMRRFIDGLNPDDTFTIIDFANTATRLSNAPLPNTRANRDRAYRYIDSLDANGGTNLMEGMEAVLKFPAAPNERLRSIVLLTDGYIGNDVEVIGAVREQLQRRNRLFTFGVGSSVNRFLIERLAEVGRGMAQVVRYDEPVAPAAETFFSQIANPVLTDVAVRWEGPGDAPILYPSALPDLFAAQPLVLFGKKADRQNGTLIITGRTAQGQPYEQRFNLTFDQANDNPAIAQLWGRSRLKDLMLQMNGGEVQSLVEAATQTALDYRLLSNYTAFVAVSEEVRVDPDGSRRTVSVPVEMPDGVSHEGIFGDMEGMGVPRAMGMPPQSAPLPAPPPTQRSGGLPRGRVDSLAASEAPLTGNFPEEDAPVQILRADGWGDRDRAQLIQTLTAVLGNPGPSGTLLFTVEVRGGAIVRLILDDRASTLGDRATIRQVEAALRSLTGLQVADGQTRLELQVR
ncbi:MAG: VWA domain-containing protein [Cyanobacteria bacterium]|nr:VWA domain-containing protein [Cyanobacteriota bacterium]